MLDFVMVRLLTKKAMKMEIFSLKISFCPCQGALIDVVMMIQKKVIYRNICFISIVKLIMGHFPWVVEILSLLVIKAGL